MEWLRIGISALCGFCLVVIVLALIFKQKFRRDLTAVEGKASFGGFSVGGVAILAIFGMFLVGMIYPVVGVPSDGTIADFIESLQLGVTDQDSARTQINKLKNRVRALKDSLGRGLPDTITSLEPDDNISEKIRIIAAEGKGPWGPFSSAKKVLFSVPQLSPGEVHGCPDHYRKDVEISYRSRRITVKVNGLMYQARNCRELAEVDFHINCQDARRLLPELTCDVDNNALWPKEEEQRVLAHCSIILTETAAAGD